jgi:LysR family transcriptional regulator, glycine cleavage system transcriptional activator
MMHRDIPSFASISSFEAAARHLSFKAAAEELNVTQSAISHQVKALEEYLRVSLFLRGTRSITLTQEGSRYLGDISLLLDQLAEATSHFRDSDLVGPLFVTATPAFAARWLVPRIAAFRAGHPRIELHIATSSRPPDFARDRIDVAIRFGQEKLPGFMVVPFFSTTMFPVASPRLLNGPRNLRRPNDLRHFTLLHAEVGDRWQDWLRSAGVADFDLSTGPRFEHCELLLRGAEEAQGVALTYGALVEADLAAGRLIRLFDIDLSAPVCYSIVSPETWSSRPKIAAFRNWLLKEPLTRKDIHAIPSWPARARSALGR